MKRWTVILLLSAFRALAQNACSVPSAVIAPQGPTIFTPEQEDYVGNVFADLMQRRTPTYHQADLTAPLDRIASRVLKYLPPAAYKFQISLIEIPTANAFTTLGGRIYVSRRLIAAAENEDELAGVLAHEIGHVLARQGSVRLTRIFKDALNVTSVTDRDDIFQKINQLLEAAARKPQAFNRLNDELTADRVCLKRCGAPVTTRRRCRAFSTDSPTTKAKPATSSPICRHDAPRVQAHWRSAEGNRQRLACVP